MKGPDMNDEAIARMKALRDETFKHLCHLGEFKEKNGWTDPYNTIGAFRIILRSLDIRITETEGSR